MEIYQLRTFIRVAESGNLTRAAEQLNLSQPAVSAHIKMLEEEYGLQLFRRTPRGMQLSEAGAQLLNKAREIMAALAGFECAAAAISGRSSVGLKLAVNTHPEVFRLDEMIEAVPCLNLSITTSSTPRILKDLLAGEYDGGFIFGKNDYAEIEALELACFELVIVAPEAWAERVMGRPIEEIARLPWVMTPPDCPFTRTLKDAFGELAPDIRVTADQEATLKRMVLAGKGLSLLPRFEVVEGMLVWDGTTLPLAFSFVCRRDRLNEPALVMMREALQRMWH